MLHGSIYVITGRCPLAAVIHHRIQRGFSFVSIHPTSSPVPRAEVQASPFPPPLPRRQERKPFLVVRVRKPHPARHGARRGKARVSFHRQPWVSYVEVVHVEAIKAPRSRQVAGEERGRNSLAPRFRVPPGKRGYGKGEGSPARSPLPHTQLVHVQSSHHHTVSDTVHGLPSLGFDGNAANHIPYTGRKRIGSGYPLP